VTTGGGGGTTVDASGGRGARVGGMGAAGAAGTFCTCCGVGAGCSGAWTVIDSSGRSCDTEAVAATTTPRTAASPASAAVAIITGARMSSSI
jgi:hypothetical protein